jgi:hypothetical protein
MEPGLSSRDGLPATSDCLSNFPMHMLVYSDLLRNSTTNHFLGFQGALQKLKWLRLDSRRDYLRRRFDELRGEVIRNAALHDLLDVMSHVEQG